MPDKVLVVGGGAREHAMAAAVHRAGADVYAILKNRNPGIMRLAEDAKLISETDPAVVADVAKTWGVDIVVLGKEASVETGVADAILAQGIGCASPTRAAGEVEWSKSFMRNLLEKHDIPGRCRWKSFTEASSEIRDFITELDGNVAVKPVGLTGGKGVKVTGDHLQGIDDAVAYAEEILATNFGGAEVVVEEKLEGEEFSLQAFCDGNTAIPMPPVQDHKRAFEGDKGPNTGGMGSYSDADHLLPFVTQDDVDAATRIMRKVVTTLRNLGRQYVGTIYGQFMLTRDGPKFVEINARFGDPEAMNVLELLESDYVEILYGMAEGNLPASKVKFAPEATVCKYVVPAGYGEDPQANQPVNVDEAAIRNAGAVAYYASVNETDGGLRTTTSRSVGVVARGGSIEAANEKVEEALKHVTGPALFARHDIGTRELVQKRVEHLKSVRGG